MKKKLLSFITCGVCDVATIVLAFFGECTVYTIFTAVNLVVIVVGTLCNMSANAEKRRRINEKGRRG